MRPALELRGEELEGLLVLAARLGREALDVAQDGVRRVRRRAVVGTDEEQAPGALAPIVDLHPWREVRVLRAVEGVAAPA